MRSPSTVIDIRPVQNEHRHRGIGRYVLGAISAVIRQCPASLTVLTHGDRPIPDSLGALPRYVSRRPHALRYHAGWAVDEFLITRAARRHGWALFHATDPDAVPRGGVATVVTVYDMTPTDDKGVWRGLSFDRRLAYVRMLSNARRASRIVTISNFVRGQLAGRLNYPPERIAVCYPGIDRTVWRARPAGSIEETDGVLFVGAPGENKNVGGLLRALARLRDAPRLTVTGPWSAEHARWLYAQAAGLGLEVALEPFVTDDRLRELYGRAAVVVVPSRHEGFGLPVLEAMAIGTPVIVSDVPALVETGGDAVRTVPVDDDDALGQAIDSLLRDARARQEMHSRGIARAALFSWEATATRLCDVYAAVRG